MTGPALSSSLIRSKDGNGVEKGARTDILQWRSQGTSVLLGLPICVDEWLDPSSSAMIEQVVVHLRGKDQWGEGALSVLPKASEGVSSFEVLDRILCHFADRWSYPLLKRIVLCMSSLSSVLDSDEETLTLNLCEQPDTAWARNSCIDTRSSAHHPYHLTKESIQERQDPHFYLARMLRERYIHLIHGEADLGVGDDRPEAMAQGAHRLERARNYHAHLFQMETKVDQLPSVRRWTIDWAPGVKHDGRATATSDAAIARIFPNSSL
ncbi:hypothetical protein PHSY_001869 [Pseudozyma hubeiensis SY62]|uniref:Uncharacterized protein n=1 Tax=Pseudozyma hubeiensis (strain SY62) TaxID=1305764 RepID=R9NZK5_PSEHS|nr:hypothetical protein PHSY_001869 [Pseudozyma hubeiensis SY62]GAC94298.1 hypothetical protein PHSY_001869 [Pseudozyma hubeiensis SY62]